MPEWYYQDQGISLCVGNANTVLADMPAASVQCVVTSPPYWGKRDYGTVDQLGLEPTPTQYIQALVGVFERVRRVLADAGTCWLNLGDTYAGSWGNYALDVAAGSQNPARRRRYGTFRPPQAGLTGKNLLGLPWRVALALQESGWILRNAIVWNKPNPMPESVADRLSTCYEMVFLLVKQRRYWFNLDAVRRPYTGDRTLSRRARKGATKPNSISTPWPPSTNTQALSPEHGHPDQAATVTSNWQQTVSERGRNPGDVWTVATRPYPGAHFAVQPVDIPLRCIAAGCRPGGVVLDPFSGAGTTLIAARQLGHPAIGIDLRADYHHLALERLDLTPGPRGEPW